MIVARWRPLALVAGAGLTLSVALPATIADAHSGPGDGSRHTSGHASHHSRHLAHHAQSYVQTNLVSDVPGLAQKTDPNLVNAWGASFRGASPLWVSDTGTNVSTLYAGGVDGTPQTVNPLVVKIPGGLPTGQASNSTTDFVVKAADGTSGPAFFLFAGITGHLTGWNPTVGITGTAPSTNAQDAIVTPGGSYTGLAMGQPASGPRLYAADFGTGKVEMYDGSWAAVHIRGAFQDRSLPRSFAPFNVAVSGNRVYVAFAKRGADGRDVAGRGLGRVDVFTLNGRLVQRIRDHGSLDAPWGLTIAPAGFGKLSGDLLVGNFGNGQINAFRPHSLRFDATVRDHKGRAITIPGLWSLLPGNGVEGGTDQVLFTAGPANETHGLLGSLSLGK
jgi:uncharacterized protein (TIGR03118 family)